MEETLIVLGILLVLGLWLAGNILGLIAIIKMGGLRRRIVAMEKKLELALRAGLPVAAAPAEAPVTAERRAREQAAAYRLDREEVPEAEATPEAAAAPPTSEAAEPVHEPEHGHEPEPMAGQAQDPEGSEAPAPPETPESDDAAQVPPLAARDTPDGGDAPPPKASLEERIALAWFTRIGAAVLVLGVAYFFKYAVDNDWIGPWGRVSLGLVAGVGVLFLAEWMKPRLQLSYFTGLLGVGLALLYVSTFAAYGFYALLPMPLTFLALVVVALLAGALALRHASQLILVMGLLAALANPILLSTGHDRPLELFAYLLLVTGGTLWVAHRLRSIIGVWLPKAGVVIIGLGWYGKFFEVSAPFADPTSGNLVESSAGAYFPLSARLVPLAAVALFSALWVASGVFARRAEWQKVSPNGVLAFVLAFAPLAFGALLHDSPVLLAVSMILCAVAAGFLLRDEQQTPLLALPLILSFFVLLVGNGEAREAPVLSLIALAAWISIYGGLLLRNGIPRTKDSSNLLSAGLLATTLVLGVILASVLLIPDHAILLALTVLGLSAAFAIIGSLSDRPWMAALGVVITLLALSVVAPRDSTVESPPIDPVFLGLAALWGLVFLGVSARRLLREGAATPLALVIAGVGGPVGFVGLVLIHAGFEASTISSLCAAGAGLAVFAVGALTLKRHPDARTPATVMLGAGLALLTLAVGLAFAGVTLTLSWTIMAAATAVIAAREKREAWMWAAIGLFGLVLMRVLTIDLWVIENARNAFLWSNGEEGTLFATPFWNARALALLGVSVALLVSARFFGRAEPLRFARGVATVFGVVGYLLLLTLFIVDVRELVTSYPALGASVGSSPEFQGFLDEYYAAMDAQSQLRAMSVTLTLGVIGGLVLTLGFIRRDVLSRWLGLITLAVTFGKLGLWDIWSLPRLFQVVVLVSVGCLFLGAGFLYARFGKRLVGYFKVGASVLLLASLSPLAARASGPVDPTGFERRAQLEVSGPGLHSVVVSPELYRASHHSSSLSDLRLLAADGTELPWVLRDRPVGQPANLLQVEVLDPVTLPDGSTQATFDLGASGLRHNEIDLEIGGDDFLRRCRIEVSDDREGWALLGGGVLVRSRQGTTGVERTELSYPRSAARYLRVTLAGGSSGRPLPIGGGRVSFRPRAAWTPVQRLPLPIVERGLAPNGKKASWVRLDLGSKGWPIRALELSISDEAFERPVRVEASESGERWFTVTRGLVYRADDDASLGLRLSTEARHLRLVFDDGDDPPLTVTAVEGEARLQELVFRARSEGPVFLYVGHPKLGAPDYDLPAILARQAPTSLPEVALGALGANPEHEDEAKSPGPWSERARVPLGVVIGLLLAALGIWAVRMLRDGPMDS